MFIKAFNTSLLVRETGEIWTEDLQTADTYQDAVGDIVIDHRGKVLKVKDLVVSVHGQPPNQLRYPNDDEETVLLDGDKTNINIKNLTIKSKERVTKSASDLSDDHVERILGLIASNTSYQDIIDDYAEKGIVIHKPQLSELKKKFLTGKKKKK